MKRSPDFSAYGLAEFDEKYVLLLTRQKDLPSCLALLKVKDVTLLFFRCARLGFIAVQIFRKNFDLLKFLMLFLSNYMRGI